MHRYGCGEVANDDWDFLSLTSSHFSIFACSASSVALKSGQNVGAVMFTGSRETGQRGGAARSIFSKPSTQVEHGLILLANTKIAVQPVRNHKNKAAQSTGSHPSSNQGVALGVKPHFMA
jgi:hypothetical protein